MSTSEHWTTITLITLALASIVPLALVPAGCGRDRARLALTGALAAMSFLPPPSVVAAAIVLPWLLVVIVTLRRMPTLPALWGLAAGAWFLAHRADLDPLEVGRGITLLTVAHFLVAGCGLSALMLAVARRSEWRSRHLPVALHQIGMLTVAAGILIGGWLEAIGAAMIIAALLLHSIAAWLTPLQTRQWMLRTSALAWTSPMVLALLWALRMHLPQPVVGSIATMLAHHGTVNAVAVVLAGLVALDHQHDTQFTGQHPWREHRAHTAPTRI
jgi:hypothetical protein